jgi:hypothetical protein
VRSKIRQKYSKNHENEKHCSTIYEMNLTKKHDYIDANQEFTRCRNCHNILPLFGGLEGSLTFSHLLSYTMKRTHTSQKATMARGGRGMTKMLTSPPVLGVLFIEKTNG